MIKGLKRVFSTVGEVVFKAYKEVKYAIETNLRTFCWLVSFSLPYLMFFVGKYSLINQLYAYSIPIVIPVVLYFIKEHANKIGKGTSIPLPSRRFTIVSSDGEVSIANDRIQELLLYTADLEDYLERKGLM